MTTVFYFIRLAVHNLRRGGQRVFAALLCITFGIMALVAMTLVAQTIAGAVQVTPAQLLGGDIGLGRKTEAVIAPAQISELQALQQSGAISRFTLIAHTSALTFHTPNSGALHFVGNGMGIEPDNYPLAGSLTIGEPAQAAGLPALLAQVGDTVITRDVAEEYHLQVGDPLILADLRAGMPVAGVVRGIAFDTPNHQGDKIYYSLVTAARLANDQPVINTAMLNADRPAPLVETLDRGGWSVDWAAERLAGKPANLWVIGLRAGGILGLLVSGVGIANTMQVLLRRRRREIAIWKALGYRERDLSLIFALEAGLLGLAGSLPGALLGVLISTGLLGLFRRTSSLLYGWSFSLTPPLMGILVGTLSTVIFAGWAIAAAGQVSPMALLRGEPASPRERLGCRTILLGLALAVPFTAIASLVMESVWGGIGVLIVIGSGLAGLSGLFSGLLWLCTHLIPRRAFPLLGMAVTSLRRRGTALVFAMIALFVGVLSMSLGLAVTQKSEANFAAQPGDRPGYNLTILGAPGQEPAIRAAVESLRPAQVGVGYRAALAGVTGPGGEPIPTLDAVLVGRSNPEDYLVSGSAWGSRPDGVYVYAGADLPAGSQVTVTFRDGAARTFPVVGSYTFNDRTFTLNPPAGLLMTAEGFTQAARPDALSYFVQVAPAQVGPTAAKLGTALPQATVIDLTAYAARFMRGYRNVYVLPMIMAGLALLAGFLLVANSVSLAMLDRRFEIGILKTVGYSHRQVLSILALEYGMVGLLATGAGVLVIQSLLAALAVATHLPARAALLGIPALTLIGFCGVGLTLLVVLAVTWTPTRVSPVIVLNERE